MVYRMFSRHRAAVVASIVVWSSTIGIGAQQPAPYDPTKERLASTGSGFILTSSGYIVTNHHVVAGATALNVQIPGREKAVLAKLAVDDPQDDLAIVKVDGPLGNPPIAFADSAQIKIGQDVFALGYPLGLRLGQTVRAATGTISSLLGPRDREGLYQVSAPVQHGNSGGPVFNQDGQLIGVVVSGFEDVQNVNFVIKGAVLAKLLQQIPEGSDILRRNAKMTGRRDQQVETLSKWVVQMLNFRPEITTATREFRRSPSASTRVDVLGGKMAVYVDSSKWTDILPTRPGVSQQFQITKGEKGESKARFFVEWDKSETTLDGARVKYFRELQKETPDLSIGEQELRVVNGVQALTTRVRMTTSGGSTDLVVQFYAGPEGSVALTGSTAPQHLNEFQSDFDEVFSGFEKPKSPALTSAPWLTEWSRKAIRQIDSPVLIRIAAREPDVARYQKILSAYQDATPQIYVEYIDIEKSPDLAKNLGLLGAGGAHLDYKGRSLKAGINAEVDVTKALMRLASGPQKVYFTQVHSERDLASADPDGYSLLAAWLDRNNYSLERLVPTADNKVPADAAVVIAAGPRRDFSALQITSLKNYLATGGRVLMLLDPVSSPPTPNLIAFAKEWGIDVGGAVADNSGNAVAATYASHPALLGFRDPITFPSARVIGLAGGSSARGAVTLIQTKQSTGLGAAVSGKPTAAPPNSTVQAESRVLVIGDSDFITNANIATGENSALFASLLLWMTEPVPPADLSK
jgi:hypothetical protein